LRENTRFLSKTSEKIGKNGALGEKVLLNSALIVIFARIKNPLVGRKRVDERFINHYRADHDSAVGKLILTQGDRPTFFIF
jgi:hypothetical protein